MKINIFKYFNRFKKKKPTVVMPEPDFKDNSEADRFNKNVRDGVRVLQLGKTIMIHGVGDPFSSNNMRNDELAMAIKSGFINEYVKVMERKIIIERIGSGIKISLNNAAEVQKL